MTKDEFRAKSAQGGFDTTGMSDAEMFLNPKSFQAVGKVEGWEQEECMDEETNSWRNGEWHDKMYAMIDTPCEGKTIEEYLETL